MSLYCFMKIQNVFKASSVKSGLTIGVVTLALPLVTLAQGSGITDAKNPPVITGFTPLGVLTLLNNVVTWLFTIFLIIAVIFIIIAAFRYLFSGGDPAGVKKATQAVVFAAVAIAVALLSVSLRFIVEQLVGSPMI